MNTSTPHLMLSDAELLEILEDWSFWEEGALNVLKITPRQLVLPPQLDPDIALIIQGVRRSGKSTLLAQLPNYYGLNPLHCYFCNFEDPRLLGHLNHALLTAIVKLARSRIPPSTPCYFFFDEIQYVEGFEKWLHSQLERPRGNYFVLTGSNAALLSGELGTALTGRHLTLELYPFCFSEYQLACPDGGLLSYLKGSGFPRVLRHHTPNRLLQEYFNDIILRDVLRHVHARSPEAIKQVVKMTFESCGSALSYRRIAAVAGLTVETVQIYLEACEQAYLLFECPFFAFSEKKRLSHHKKFYPIDPGLRSAITTKIGEDLGKNLEILAYLRLRQTYGSVYYWNTPLGEVDFVVQDGSLIIPYQVTLEGAQPRHYKALEAFYHAFPQAEEAVFITQDNAESFI